MESAELLETMHFQQQHERSEWMKKQSKRVALTKDIIELAYLDVLELKPDGKITVKEVCQQAGVNRTTFYKYYSDAEDLARVVRKNLLDHLEDLLKETIPENYSDTFEFLSRVILSVYRDPRMRKLPMLYKELEFRMHLERLLHRYYYYQKFGSRFSEDEWIRITFCHFGFLGLLETWIQEGMQISPEKVANCVISFSKALVTPGK